MVPPPALESPQKPGLNGVKGDLGQFP